MLIFFGFCDVEAKREGNPHSFSMGGLSVCLDRLKAADVSEDVTKEVSALTTCLGHDVFFSHRNGPDSV